MMYYTVSELLATIAEKAIAAEKERMVDFTNPHISLLSGAMESREAYTLANLYRQLGGTDNIYSRADDALQNDLPALYDAYMQCGIHEREFERVDLDITRGGMQKVLDRYKDKYKKYLLAADSGIEAASATLELFGQVRLLKDTITDLLGKDAKKYLDSIEDTVEQELEFDK